MAAHVRETAHCDLQCGSLLACSQGCTGPDIPLLAFVEARHPYVYRKGEDNVVVAKLAAAHVAALSCHTVRDER